MNFLPLIRLIWGEWKSLPIEVLGKQPSNLPRWCLSAPGICARTWWTKCLKEGPPSLGPGGSLTARLRELVSQQATQRTLVFNPFVVSLSIDCFTALIGAPISHCTKIQICITSGSWPTRKDWYAIAHWGDVNCERTWRINSICGCINNIAAWFLCGLGQDTYMYHMYLHKYLVTASVRNISGISLWKWLRFLEKNSENEFFTQKLIVPSESALQELSNEWSCQCGSPIVKCFGGNFCVLPLVTEVTIQASSTWRVNRHLTKGTRLYYWLQTMVPFRTLLDKGCRREVLLYFEPEKIITFLQTFIKSGHD
jgi:hypothetical protein